MASGRSTYRNYRDYTQPDSTLLANSNRVQSRQQKIRVNRRFEGFWEFLNQSNFLATAVEFMTTPAPGEVFTTLWFAKWVNAPIAIVAGFFQSMTAIRKAWIKRDTFSIANAFVVVGTNLAMIVGAIGVAAGIAAMSVVAPVLIAASIGVKALWDLGTAIVFGIKAALTNNEDLTREHRNRALGALVDGIAGSLLTGALVAIYLVAAPIVQTVLTGLAMAAAAIGMLAGMTKFFFARSHSKIEEKALLAAEEEELVNTHQLNRQLGHDGETVDYEAHDDRRTRTAPVAGDRNLNPQGLDQPEPDNRLMARNPQ